MYEIKSRIIPLFIMMVFLLPLACGKKDGKKEETKPAEMAAGMDGDMGGMDPAMAVDDAAMKVAGKVDDKVKDAKNLTDPNKELTAEEYKKLLLDHAACEIKNDEIDYECPAVKALREAMSGGRKIADLTGGGDALGKELLGHAAPAVRIKAAGLMSSFLGTKGSSQDMIVEAAKNEKHPAVLKALIRTVSNDGAKNPKVAEMLLWAANHESPVVRRSAVYALSSSWNREMKGGPEKLIELMEKDADEDVRAAACEYAGNLGDEKFMPSFTKLTADANEKIRNACTKGLVYMWWSYPFHENASEKAYKLTLKILKKKPRTKDNPFWTIPGMFRSKNKDKFPEWQKKAPWFKQAELNAVLADLVKDTNVNWLGRNGAVEALVENGATKAEMEKIRKSFTGEPKGDDVHIVSALDKAIAKM
jgi:hypothetical protein